MPIAFAPRTRVHDRVEIQREARSTLEAPGLELAAMPTVTRIVRPGPEPRAVLTETGERLDVPENWTLLPPGDAGLTRRVKASGPTWTVQEKVGRKMFSRGVWASEARVRAARDVLVAERAEPAYAERLEAGRERRARQQVVYVGEFRGAVLEFLAFAPRYRALAESLADAVTTHATPVGSGTVARTERIPVDERAEAAVIAWMRHQTTAYDELSIARIKGERRRVRRMLAERSRQVLEAYRRGADVDALRCPLVSALSI